MQLLLVLNVFRVLCHDVKEKVIPEKKQKRVRCWRRRFSKFANQSSCNYYKKNAIDPVSPSVKKSRFLQCSYDHKYHLEYTRPHSEYLSLVLYYDLGHVTKQPPKA